MSARFVRSASLAQVRVLLFDPTNAASAAYNPLLEVRRGEWEVRDVQNVADVLVDPEGSLEKRNHWEKTSHALLVGAILHILYAGEDRTLAGVVAFLSDPQRPIDSTLRAMMTTPHLGEAGVHPVVASAARELLNKSENERSRQLLTPGEIMQLPPDDEIVMVAGVQPVRAKKVRYFTDRRFTDRMSAPPDVRAAEHPAHADDWSKLAPIAALPPVASKQETDEGDGDAAEGGIRREPEIDRTQDIAPEPRSAPTNEFDPDEPDGEDADAIRARVLAREQRMAARRAALDPNDGIEL